MGTNRGGVTEAESGDGVAEWLGLESSGVIAIVLCCGDCDCPV